MLRSGLALSGFNDRQSASGANDGVLTAVEVAGLDLQGTEVVTLSASECRLGESKAGEGVFGLRRVLVQADSKTQVTSLWKVDRQATRDLLAALRGQPLPVTGMSLSRDRPAPGIPTFGRALSSPGSRFTAQNRPWWPRVCAAGNDDRNEPFLHKKPQ